jgi:uncharacterized membrane protein YidH (DUF202 family)
MYNTRANIRTDFVEPYPRKATTVGSFPDNRAMRARNAVYASSIRAAICIVVGGVGLSDIVLNITVSANTTVVHQVVDFSNTFYTRLIPLEPQV